MVQWQPCNVRHPHEDPTFIAVCVLDAWDDGKHVVKSCMVLAGPLKVCVRVSRLLGSPGAEGDSNQAL